MISGDQPETRSENLWLECKWRGHSNIVDIRGHIRVETDANWLGIDRKGRARWLADRFTVCLWLGYRFQRKTAGPQWPETNASALANTTSRSG